MPLTWNVQPYRTLTELRNAYTTSVFTVTRANSERWRNEIEEWMRRNAPWKDRTVEERVYAYLMRAGERMKMYNEQNKRKPTAKSVPLVYRQGARAGLKVLLYKDELEAALALKKSTVEQMTEIGRKGLNILNAQRDIENRLRSKGQRKKPPLTRLPNAGNINRVGRALQSQVPLILDMEITHEKKLVYAIWLEIAKNGRYNIIKRTLEHWLPKIMNEMRSTANLKQYRNMPALSPRYDTEEEAYNKFVEQENQYRIKRDGVTAEIYQPWSKKVKETKKKRSSKEYTPEERRRRFEIRQERKQRSDEARRAAKEIADEHERDMEELKRLRSQASTISERRAIEQRFYDEQARKKMRKGLEDLKRRNAEANK